MKKEYLECGIVRSPHGVRGILNVECWCDSPRVLAKQKRVYILGRDGSYKEVNVISASPAPDRVLMGLEGIDSREAAQGYKNTVLYLHRDDIPVKRGQMLLADMIGLAVIDADTGVRYGEIKEVTEVPRGLLYTVATDSGDVYYPSGKEFIKKIDPDEGMLITPIPGFFED